MRALIVVRCVHLGWAVAVLVVVCPPRVGDGRPLLEKRTERRERRGQCVHLAWAVAVLAEPG